MRTTFLFCTAILSAPTALAPHDRAFWRSIVQHDYAPPAGQPVPALAAELSGMLGSSDPELRDEFAYSILTAWIFQKRLLDPAAIRPLEAAWLSNLKAGVGTPLSDGIYRRSFSALMLSVVIARDNADSFLSEAEFRGVLTAALGYLGAERDLRGYDPKTGWMHATAHTADLLKFLGRSRFLTKADQRAMLDAISAKLIGARQVFTHGEDERLARAILSLVHRPDFDRDGFTAWVDRASPVNPTTATPAPALLDGNQNLKNLLAKLEVVLALDGGLSPQGKAGLESVRGALAKLF